MSKTIGDGAAITMQKESFLQSRLPPRLLGLLCLKLPPAISGGMTKIPEGCESRLARIINSTEERKIRKWFPSRQRLTSKAWRERAQSCLC